MKNTFNKANGDANSPPPGPDSTPVLKRLTKPQLLKRDVFGRTILHVCVLLNDVISLTQLLRCPDIKAILLATDYESGWNILHYICFYKRLACFKVLMAHLEYVQTISPNLLLDLLKRKDRSKIAPLSLLQNDYKDLYWIPTYINENNEFHLERRFEVSVSEDQSEPPPSPTFPRLRQHDWWSEDRGGSDVYVFGSNTNNNLGVGDASDRAMPTKISGIRNVSTEDADLHAIITRPRYKQLEVSKYHSVLCTMAGDVYTCGIGSRGRLGHGNNQNAFRFKRVTFFDSLKVTQTTASHSHTLALTSADKIYSWGQNAYGQLGFTSSNNGSFKSRLNDVYESEPREVVCADFKKRGSKFLGLASSKIHSLAYTASSIYFWGLNIGQMGISSSEVTIEHRVNGVLYKGSVNMQPREVVFHDEIKFVATCETCTCVVTVTNDIFVFYSHQRVKLPKVLPRIDTASHFDYFKPSILTSAQVIKKVVLKSHSNVHILLDIGDVVGFSINTSDSKSLRSIKYNYVWSATEADMRAVDIDNSYDGSVILCTKNGAVLVKANAPNLIVSRSSHLPSPSSTKKFSQVQHLNKVLRVSCDDGFSSFGVVRDDIDSLPFKLQQNDFFKDMQYLSPLVEADIYRKQDQLLDTDHDLNCYITDFFYPTKSESDSAEEHLFTIGFYDKTQQPKKSKPSKTSNDMLLNLVSTRHDHEKNKEPSESSIYQTLLEDENKSFCRSLARGHAHGNFEPELIWSHQKFCDGHIKFKNDDTTFGFHTKLFLARSDFCATIFTPQNDDEFFIHGDIKGHYDPETHTVWFDSNISPGAVLAFIHFMYTNTILPFWDELSEPDSSQHGPKLRSQFFDLISLFGMEYSCGQTNVYLSQLRSLAEDTSDGDVTIQLADDKSIQCSSLIVSRSAFFETILSGRWDASEATNDLDGLTEPKFVALDDISVLQMKTILKHLYGCNDLQVFSAARETVAESFDSDDFVNFLLDMIVVADELLLVQLKHLCELAIKEFVNVENVLILIAHADWLGAKRLFMSCCWYLYNNLDVILFDHNLRNLDEPLLQKVEDQLNFLSKCKSSNAMTAGAVCEAFRNDFACLKFATDLSLFNEVYMSDRKGVSSFEPLVDIKPDATTITEESKRRSSSRKLSRKGSNDVTAELQKLSMQKDGGRRVSESAIADDDEFEVVGARRRKSKTSTQELTPGGVQKAEPPRLTSQTTRKPSNSFISTEPGLDLVGRRKSSSSSAPLARFGDAYTPVLGETAEDSRKQSRIKFPASMKKSQKERRKHGSGSHNGAFVQHHNGSSERVDLRNPWKVSEEKEDDALRLESLPVLGQAPSTPPTMSTVMLQETLSQIEQQEIEAAQSLEDIQREQEFERWWQEESKRVQQEIDLANGVQTRGQGSFRGRGNRGKRGRGRP